VLDELRLLVSLRPLVKIHSCATEQVYIDTASFTCYGRVREQSGD